MIEIVDWRIEIASRIVIEITWMDLHNWNCMIEIAWLKLHGWIVGYRIASYNWNCTIELSTDRKLYDYVVCMYDG